MTTPSHPHAITIENNPKRVKASFNGKLIADSQRALVLREGKLPPVSYIPRDDVNMDHLQRTDHTTHCPFKGDASYFTVSINGETADNAVWSYETPFSSVEDIKGLLAFDPAKVDLVEETP